MTSERKKKVWAVGNLEPMADDRKSFPEADYLASGTSKPHKRRTWPYAILAIAIFTIVGLLIIYGVAARFDYLRHH